MSKKIEIDEDLFIEKWEENLLIDDMCRIFGISKGTYINICRRLGLKRTKEQVAENIKKGVFNKYGVENPFQSEVVKEKIKETMIEKYGADHPAKVKEIRDKTENTFMKRYGVKTPTRSKEIMDRVRETNLEKYGVEYSFLSKDFKQKSRETCLKKYGHECAIQSDEIKNKVVETNMKRYGVKTTLLAPEVMDKINKTMFDKYGTIEMNRIHYDELTTKVMSSREEMEKFILSHEDRSIGALVSELKCQRCAFGRRAHDFGLWDMLYLYRSKPEFELNNYINSLGVNTIISDKEQLDGMEIDIYCPEHKIGIEFNGNYWHCSLKKERNYHFHKTEFARSKGIRIIHIYQYEWDDPVRQDIIKSMLKIAFGKVESRVYARQCDIREISNKIAAPFNTKNHLQGHKNAQVTYGLYYKNELVQLMSFSYNTKKSWWEIERGCPGSNNIVVGGVSKLFAHFIKTHNPERIFSYCDYNKFDGKGYEAIGMKFVGYTGPDMKWFMPDNTVVNRKPSKHDELKKEAIAQIWGAGSKKYLWTSPSIT